MTVVSLFGARSENKVTVNFINRDGEKITVKASPGDTLLDVVVQQDLDIDGYGEFNIFLDTCFSITCFCVNIKKQFKINLHLIPVKSSFEPIK